MSFGEIDAEEMGKDLKLNKREKTNERTCRQVILKGTLNPIDGKGENVPAPLYTRRRQDGRLKGRRDRSSSSQPKNLQSIGAENGVGRRIQKDSVLTKASLTSHTWSQTRDRKSCVPCSVPGTHAGGTVTRDGRRVELKV